MFDPKLVTLLAFGTLLVLNGIFAGGGFFRSSSKTSALPDEPVNPPQDHEGPSST